MKFVVDQHALADAVSWVSKSLPTRPINPALHGIVIEADNNKVHLSASNQEKSSKADFSADVTENGKVLVSGHLLNEISRSLPNKPVTVQLDGARVLVTAGSAKFTLPTTDAETYPTLPEIPEITGVIASNVFAKAVLQVATAASKDESLQKYTGVFVQIKNDTITLTATDKYRLAICEVQWEATHPNLELTALLRARTLEDAAKSLTTSKNVSIYLTPNTAKEHLAGFVIDGKSLTSRMLNDSYPEYSKVIPTEFTSTAIIEVAPLLDSVRRVALVTDKTIPLRLTFTPNRLELEAGSADGKGIGEEGLNIILNGEPITIAFNPEFLMEGLNAVGTPFVKIAFTTATKAAVLTGIPTADGKEIDNYKYILMPTLLPRK